MRNECVDLKVERHTTERFGVGRRGVLASFVMGIGSVAIGWASWLQSSIIEGGEFERVAQWNNPDGGKGLMIAIGANPTDEKLRALGERLKEEFRRLDGAVVMVFDNAEAARLVRQGSRSIGEERFQRALVHQRAMYLKNLIRNEHSLTIYGAYPEPREVIHYESTHVRESSR